MFVVWPREWQSRKYDAKCPGCFWRTSIWKCGETLSLVFDIPSQSKLKLRREQRSKIVKIYASWSDIQTASWWRLEDNYSYEITFCLFLGITCVLASNSWGKWQILFGFQWRVHKQRDLTSPFNLHFVLALVAGWICTN